MFLRQSRIKYTSTFFKMRVIIFATLILFASCLNLTDHDEVKQNNKLHSLNPFKITLDDGNVMEDINLDEEDINNANITIQEKEMGTHKFTRLIIKPFINAGVTATNVVTGTASRIGKALNIGATGGLDTNTTFFKGNIDAFKKHLQMIYPGTRWCGDGDKAKSYDDLGTFAATDACCRDHDNCFEFIAAGDVKFELHNTGLFTRSHCDCDNAFYACLKNATDLIARKIGFTYFTILGPQCFKEEYPVTGCIQYSRGKCIDYRTDKSNGKLFQWFDSPLFI